MARKNARIAAAVVCAIALMGCENEPRTGQIAGPITGAAAGALVAHIVASGAQATIVGAAAGAVIGLAAGTYLDPPARIEATNATLRAFDEQQSGQAISWHTDRSAGSVTPVGEILAQGDRSCRRLHREETVAGTQFSGDVMACRTSDDLWEIIAEPADQG